MYPVSVYKKFTPQDKAYVPFNTQKQYDFDSGSAETNKITFYSARYTSESFSNWSGNNGANDTINTIKYNQLDHLYYRDFKRDLTNRFSKYHYLFQKRELYEKVNILSIPAGLFGQAVKKGSFLLSSSLTGDTIIDDSEGNLLISGSNPNDDYNTDIRSNLLNIGPVKGFRRYNLGVYDGYVKVDGYRIMPDHWRRGMEIPNPPLYYNTFEHTDEYDDSYYFNPIKYKDVNFRPVTLFSQYNENTGSIELVDKKFSAIDFNIRQKDFSNAKKQKGSQIKLGHSEKFNFNKGDDFTITFWAHLKDYEVYPTLVDTALNSLQAGDGYSQYIISKSTTKTVSAPITTQTSTEVNTTTSGALQPTDVQAELQYPFEVYVQNLDNTPHIYFSRSDGEIISIASASFNTSSFQHVACRNSASMMEIFLDGIKVGGPIEDLSEKLTQNNANLYIGSKGGKVESTQPEHGKSNMFSGSLSQINIYNNDLTDTQILNHYSSSNGSPYIGNIFYPHGMATITHPQYQHILNQNIYNSDSQLLKNFTQLFLSRSVDAKPSGLPSPTTIDVAFNDVGTRMFTLNNNTDDIFQYQLDQPYDLNTYNYIKTLQHDIDVQIIDGTGAIVGGVNEETSPTGFTFSSDGDKVFVIGTTRDSITQIPLSSSYDIGSAYAFNNTVWKSISLNEGSFNEDTPGGCHFNKEGDAFYFMGRTTGTMYQINCSGSFDVHSRTTSQSVDVLGPLTDAEGVSSISSYGFSFNPDGDKMILTTNEISGVGQSNHVYLWHLETPFDISTLVYSGYSSSLSQGDPTLNYSTRNAFNIQWEEVLSPEGLDTRIFSVEYALLAGAIHSSRINEYQIPINEIAQLKFQANHLIYEHEYQCTVDESEYNDTLNLTARKIQTREGQDMADFATSSLFKPYVTQIGLYNEQNELLVIGKLGQPIRMSDETDTTFVLRWDT